MPVYELLLTNPACRRLIVRLLVHTRGKLGRIESPPVLGVPVEEQRVFNALPANTDYFVRIHYGSLDDNSVTSEVVSSSIITLNNNIITSEITSEAK